MHGSICYPYSWFYYTNTTQVPFPFPIAAVGMLLLKGLGCPAKDEEGGLQWLKRSMEGGCAYGTGLLALQYYTSKLFSKAAETAFK